MKNLNIKSIVTVFTCLLLMKADAQFHFGISPGLQMNGAVFGYKADKFVPYLGFQMAGGSVNYTETGKKEDPVTGDIVDYKDVYKFSGRLWMPSLGCKYFFLENNKLKAYANLSLTKVFISAQVEDSNDPAVTVELKKAIDNIKIFGGQFGVGTEYFLDDNFSIGGEFGIRLLHLNFKQEKDDSVTDPNTGNPVDFVRVNSTKMNFNPTYTRFSLNFYFGK